MSAGSIAERQNTPGALFAARAFRRRYALARGWRGARIGVGLLLGAAGIVLALLESSLGEYVGAAAAAWVFFSRAVAQTYERRLQDAGAIAHEVFDTRVFDLLWNTAKIGAEPAPEDLRNWGRRQDEAEMRDWYPDVRPAQHPVDVLICQRATVTWARQDHATYAQALRWAVGVGLVLTIVLGWALGLELGEYLLRLGLPVLPLALDVLDVATANADVGHSKVRVEREASALYTRAKAVGQPPSTEDCRQLQDEIYATRRLPGVPNFFYRLTHAGRQQNMEDVAATQVQELPGGLR